MIDAFQSSHSNKLDADESIAKHSVEHKESNLCHIYASWKHIVNCKYAALKPMSMNVRLIKWYIHLIAVKELLGFIAVHKSILAVKIF